MWFCLLDKYFQLLLQNARQWAQQQSDSNYVKIREVEIHFKKSSTSKEKEVKWNLKGSVRLMDGESEQQKWLTKNLRTV